MINAFLASFITQQPVVLGKKIMPKLQKLHRSQNHRMIAGVMGGIAEYLGWSPTVTRLAFFLISTFSAAVPGILIYIILWIIMPNATPRSYIENANYRNL